MSLVDDYVKDKAHQIAVGEDATSNRLFLVDSSPPSYDSQLQKLYRQGDIINKCTVTNTLNWINSLPIS